MFDRQHFDVLMQGQDAWNKWRLQNSDTRPRLKGVELKNADLSGIDFSMTDIHDADLSGANLQGANLSTANLSGASLVSASLVGANLINSDLHSARMTDADLRRASLWHARLYGAELRHANLAEANLIDADLREADLEWAQLQNANLALAKLGRASLAAADLRGASLMGAHLIETNLEKANLSGCLVYGISAWNLRMIDTVQRDLVITDFKEPTITVDNLEVAQFLYLLLSNGNIRGVIDTITSKTVLILGRFTSKRKAVLDAIRDELRSYDLVPVLFDFDKPQARDTHETITLLARMARFIIADITEPKSVPQELVAIVESLPSVPVQPLLELGSEPWGMYDHIRRYPWVLPICFYRDIQDLLASLSDKVVEQADAKAKELRK
jgi:uncharacterized protein YjbI with pentapeptide repeats